MHIDGISLNAAASKKTVHRTVSYDERKIIMAMFLSCVLLIVGFIFLVKGADWFVGGCSSVAKLLHVPSIIIGLTIVAFGTSAPEAAVSITAALKGSNDIAIGNVVGSNFFNLLVVVGICAMIKPMKVSKDIMKNEFPQSIIIGILLLVLCLDTFIFKSEANSVGRIDGVILLVLFAGFVFIQIYNALKAIKGQKSAPDGLVLEATDVEVHTLSPLKSVICIVVGLALVILGGDFVVDSATAIARAVGLSEAFIGLTIVAFGTSLPELVTSIVAAKKGENDLALGNVVGSNIFNILMVLGASAALHPVAVSMDSIYDLIILAVVSIISYIFARRKYEISRAEGGVMVAMYAAYIVYLFMR